MTQFIIAVNSLVEIDNSVGQLDIGQANQQNSDEMTRHVIWHVISKAWSAQSRDVGSSVRIQQTVRVELVAIRRISKQLQLDSVRRQSSGTCRSVRVQLYRVEVVQQSRMLICVK